VNLTIPAKPEDDFPTHPVTVPVLTPLARAALANGVSVEDVYAYVTRLPERVYVLALDVTLDEALDRSFVARGLDRVRLWWRGVL
jgi:hypothetical protein